MAVGLKEIEKLGEPAATSVRDSAVRVFEGIGADALPALLQAAKDKSPRAREVAVAALGGIGGPEAERTIVAALQDGRSSVRQVAIQTLARSGVAGPVGSLSAALTHRDPATRRSAIDAMTGMTGSDSVHALARLTADPDRSVREAAVRALARQGSADAVDALLAVFEGADRELRPLAAAALKNLDWQPATARQRALGAIIGGDYQAASAEGEAAIDGLAALMTDKSAAVRKAVAQALGETRAPGAVRPLLAAVQDGDAAVRQAAAAALARIGAPAVAPLVAAVHETARAVAGDVVLRIGAPAARPFSTCSRRASRQERAASGCAAGRRGAGRTSRAGSADARAPARHQAAAAVQPEVLRRAAHLLDLVTVREVLPASRRDTMTTAVDVVVDCNGVRGRATAELGATRKMNPVQVPGEVGVEDSSMSKVIVITGASGGIGAALAVQLGQQGHRLVLAARREKELGEVAQRAGAGAIAARADVTRRADVERVRDQALQACGHVDVWVNNAGRGITRKVLDLTDEDFDTMMADNVKSALYGMQAIAPHFVQRGAGHIINISSVLSRVPFVPFRSAYSAGEGGVERADLQPARRPGPDASRHPRLARHARRRHDRLSARPPAWATPPMRWRLRTAADRSTRRPRPSSIPSSRPVAEIYTNPAQAPMVARYFQDVGAFEAQWRRQAE